MGEQAQRWRTGRLVAVVALVATALTTTGVGTASARDDRVTRVPVVLDGGDIEVRERVDGRVLRFDVSTTNEFSIFQVFAPKGGKTVADVLASLEVQIGLAESSADPAAVAASTVALTRDAHWFGGVDVTAGRPASFTVRLDGGTYHVLDIASAFATGELGEVETLRVTGDGSGRRPDAAARVDMRGTHDGPQGHGHEFRAPGTLPARGVVEVRNKDDVIHFMNIIPVQPGTTRQDIVELLEQEQEPTEEDPGPFLDGPTAAMNVLSPGQRANLHYDLPAGTYLLACFIADEEIEGTFHFDLGMFEIVQLR